MLRVDFAGGMDVLFGNKKFIQLPSDTSLTIENLIQVLSTEYLTGKKELFLDASCKSVRAGILVLVNDVDWELEGGLSAVVSPGDKVTFISTLHGG